MSEKTNGGITYDYKTVIVKREMESMTCDAYENLGWELVGSSVSAGTIFHVNLSFKRNRKIENKTNLLKLQEKVDTTLQNIEILQNKKRTAGSTPALATGLIGALTFGGGMSMVMVLGETIGFLIGGIALGLVGVGIGLFAWPIFKKIKRNSLIKLEPSLEDEYNKLADICEQAKA